MAPLIACTAIKSLQNPSSSTIPVWRGGPPESDPDSETITRWDTGTLKLLRTEMGVARIPSGQTNLFLPPGTHQFFCKPPCRHQFQER